jgi:hypothetical protein
MECKGERGVAMMVCGETAAIVVSNFGRQCDHCERFKLLSVIQSELRGIFILAQTPQLLRDLWYWSYCTPFPTRIITSAPFRAIQ